MNKKDLIAQVAERTGFTKVDSKAVVDAVFDTVAESLAKGDTVALLGFGTFQVADRPARQGVNPRTHEKIEIAAKKAVKFKPGTELNGKIQ